MTIHQIEYGDCIFLEDGEILPLDMYDIDYFCSSSCFYDAVANIKECDPPNSEHTTEYGVDYLVWNRDSNRDSYACIDGGDIIFVPETEYPIYCANCEQKMSEGIGYE